jgi:hypothetical protein
VLLTLRGRRSLLEHTTAAGGAVVVDDTRAREPASGPGDGGHLRGDRTRDPAAMPDAKMRIVVVRRRLKRASGAGC